VGMHHGDKESLFTLEEPVQRSERTAIMRRANSGSAVVVELPEAAGKAKCHGHGIAESINSASRTMLAEIGLPNADRSLQPQPYRSSSQRLGKFVRTVPSIPCRCASKDRSSVNDRNQVAWRKVQPVAISAAAVILQGINGGERLIVNPGDALARTMEVRSQTSRRRRSGRKPPCHPPSNGQPKC
jgi:hypothetical protein